MITGTTNGLSPLARGTHACFTPYVWQSRFIPAGAGNTIDAVQDETVETVYPRWRGEHQPPKPDLFHFCGLSPLARGTQHGPRESGNAGRFIPAGAGNTSSPVPSRSWNTVYPRWRGEHHWPRRYQYTYRGLSPLARGTRFYQLRCAY